MGADVYLRSVHALDYVPPDFAEIFKGVRAGATIAEAEKACRRWSDAEAMTGGYFRDNYSGIGLFSAIGMNWRRDVTPLLMDGALLPIEHARALCKRVAEATFLPVAECEAQCAEFKCLDKSDLAEQEGRFQDLEFLRARLLALLARSIELSEPLFCDL
jgi:hypothetical protein